MEPRLKSHSYWASPCRRASFLKRLRSSSPCSLYRS